LACIKDGQSVGHWSVDFTSGRKKVLLKSVKMAHPDTPVRSYMDDPKIRWRTVKPNYSMVNELYLKERTRFHPVDSLEKLVENLVKTWEMESTHKIDAQVSVLL
jgi:hypothetical protein